MRGQGARRGGGASTRDGHTAHAEQGPPGPHGPTQPEARDPSPTSTAQQARKAAPLRGSAPRAGACATDALKVPDTQPSQPTEREALAAPSPQPAPAQHAACRRAAQHKCHAQDGPDDSPAQRASHEPGHAPGPPAPPALTPAPTPPQQAETQAGKPRAPRSSSHERAAPSERGDAPDPSKARALPAQPSAQPGPSQPLARAQHRRRRACNPPAPHRPPRPLSVAGRGQCGRAKAPPCEHARTSLSLGRGHTGQGATARNQRRRWA